MKLPLGLSLGVRLILLGLGIALLGLAPQPHALRRSLEEAAEAARQGQASRAAHALAQAAQRAPWRGDWWEQAGLFAWQAGEAQAAVDYLEHARAVGVLSGRGWLALGEAYHALGEHHLTIRAWQSALESEALPPESYARLAQAYLEEGEYYRAVLTLRRWAEASPQEATPHYQLGLLLAARQPQDALPPLERAARLDAAYQPALERLRRALLSARFAEERAYTLLVCGRALAALGEWSLAAEAFYQATLARPDYAEAWAYLGEARQHPATGSLQIAPLRSSDGLAELQTALRLNPKSLAAHTFSALYWLRQANCPLAEEHATTALALDERNSTLWAQRGAIQAQCGRLKEAYASYLKAVDLSPYDPEYLRHLIAFLVDYNYEGRAQALPLARRLVARFPDQAPNLDLLGQVLLQQGDLANAERFFRRALELDPGYAPAHLHLGLLYALRGERQAALSEFHLVLTLTSDPATAAQAQHLIETYFP